LTRSFKWNMRRWFVNIVHLSLERAFHIGSGLEKHSLKTLQMDRLSFLSFFYPSLCFFRSRLFRQCQITSTYSTVYLCWRVTGTCAGYGRHFLIFVFGVFRVPISIVLPLVCFSTFVTGSCSIWIVRINKFNIVFTNCFLAVNQISFFT